MATSSALAAFATEPGWLHTLGQIAGVTLVAELLLALTIVCALMAGLAYAAWWVHRNVLPVVDAYSERAQEALRRADSAGERIVGQVATFHGAQVGVMTGLRVLLFGRPSAQGVTLTERGLEPTAAPHPTGATPPGDHA
ncbi:MAG: hypothetical protein KGO05_05715 [Chloroflexota bacterium]|nr:hypothetical protein [Chloroflexota bacterium]